MIVSAMQELQTPACQRTGVASSGHPITASASAPQKVHLYATSAPAAIHLRGSCVWRSPAG